MLITIGSVLGVVFGLAHAFYVYNVVANPVSTSGSPNQGRGIYYALWTLVLWVLFGSYVLVLWLVGVVLYTVFKVFR